MNTISSLLYATFACDRKARQRYLALNASANPQKVLRRLYIAIENSTLTDECRQALLAAGISPQTIDEILKGEEARQMKAIAQAFRPQLRPAFSLVPVDARRSHVPVIARGAVAHGFTTLLPTDIARRPWPEQMTLVRRVMRETAQAFERKVGQSMKDNYFGQRLTAFYYQPAPDVTHKLHLDDE